MKKEFVSALFAASAIAMYAQSSIDAYQISKDDLRGTARFMSMAGAFTALGGDLSTLNQNPAGIGVYRKSEVGLTLDINMTNSAVKTPVGNFTDSKTHVYCNNFGYVGAVAMNSDVMLSFNWGASYSRKVSFDRTYHVGAGAGYNMTGIGISSSLSNYIASFSGGYTPSELYDPVANGGQFNPATSPYYSDQAPDWLSVLAYNSYLINPEPGSDQYNGLWKGNDITTGVMAADVRESGHIDEYAIDFGGNIMDVVYWGMGFGITELSFTQETNYSESLANAQIASYDPSYTENGSAYYNLGNYKHINGSGFNFKACVIVKPSNELRIGLAVHTPTYYNLSQEVSAGTDFDYSSGYQGMGAYTPTSYFDWKLRSPWRFMVGFATVIGQRGIVSFDYERASYGSMNLAERGTGYDYSPENSDVSKYFEGQNTFRVGAELRITPQVSLRAGYANASSGVKKTARDGEVTIYTAGTNPSYTFDKETNYVTLGLGYRYKAFYADAAYVYKRTNSTYHAFTNYAGMGKVNAPEFNFTNTNNNIVISMGFKF